MKTTDSKYKADYAIGALMCFNILECVKEFCVNIQSLIL